MLTCISYTGNESPLSCDQARALGLMELILIAKALEEIRMVLAMSQLKKKNGDREMETDKARGRVSRTSTNC